MNRLMAGGVAGALAAAGVVAFAVPGQAQDEPEIEWFQGEAGTEPLEPHVGQQVTASDDSCFEGTTDIYWLLHPSGSFAAVDGGQQPLRADGSWAVTFTAPGEPGDYLFFGLCMPPGATQPDADDIEIITAHMADDPPVDLLDEWGVDSLLFYHLVVPVASDDGAPPTTAPGRPSTPGEGSTPSGPSTTTTVPATPPAPGARPAIPVPGTPDFTG